MRIAFLILIPALAFPELLIISGSSLGEGPFLSLLTVFETDYPNLKSLANFELDISVVGGNLFFKTGDVSDTIKAFQIDVGTVQLSYGYLRPSFSVPDALSREEWLLRVGRSYVVFSNKPKIWVNLSPFYVEAGEYSRAIGFIPRLNNVGAGFLLEDDRKFLTLYLNGLFIKVSKKVVDFSFYKPNIVVSFADGKTSIFLWNENGYVQIDGYGTKFLERVGYIYAFGKLSKREKKFGIGFRF